jgi:hypothetical protein
MNYSKKFTEIMNKRIFWFSGLVLTVLVGLWLTVVEGNNRGPTEQLIPFASEKDNPKIRNVSRLEKSEIGGKVTYKRMISGTHTQPLLFRAKPVEQQAVLIALLVGKQTLEERVQRLHGIRGFLFSKEERVSALAFLAGKNVLEGMSKSSMHYLADELLTALRLQNPAWVELPEELEKIASMPETDPIKRDYIIQHLGHLWEQYGPQAEIEKSLWQAMATSDETTPGTALIALSRGYARDQKEEPQRKVLQRALTLALDPSTKLAVRVTALSIAGEGGSAEVKALATSLTEDPNTPVILRKVAERVLR